MYAQAICTFRTRRSIPLRPHGISKGLALSESNTTSRSTLHDCCQTPLNQVYNKVSTSTRTNRCCRRRVSNQHRLEAGLTPSALANQRTTMVGTVPLRGSGRRL